MPPALIATLLPDPGTKEGREELLRKIGGRVVQKDGKDATEGGVLHWGRENGEDMDWFREEIRKVYGRAPRVLDPFAGGGAIPLEAMRLGCEATAVDINPVAWFILKCTLEYPHKLAGQKRPLPAFVNEWPDFVEKFRKASGEGTKKRGDQRGQKTLVDLPEADLAWHVRAWGRWVLEKARADLARFYPVVDGKPTVAYLWARTVTCKNCRATVPLLKTVAVQEGQQARAADDGGEREARRGSVRGAGERAVGEWERGAEGAAGPGDRGGDDVAIGGEVPLLWRSYELGRSAH